MLIAKSFPYDAMWIPVITTSFIPFDAICVISDNILSGFLLLTLPLAYGIMQYEQNLSHPSWILITALVFSVYVTDVEDNYIQTKFDNANEYKEFLDRIKNKSIYENEIELSEDDKIITLSTCSFEFNDARLVVHGKLIKN